MNTGCINYDNLRSFAYVNDRLLEGEARGIVLDFFGLGGMTIHNDDPAQAVDYAKHGIIYAVPYYNPWCWMNRQTVRFVDRIVEILSERYLNSNPKIVSSGGSMGGLSAIVYTRYAAVTPVCCVANCPVCDLLYHYGERPDLPRTIFSAFADYDGELEAAIRSASPIDLADEMPDTDYRIFHCDADDAVNKEKHSDVFVRLMNVSHRIEYTEIPGRGHCDLSPDAAVHYRNCILAALGVEN